MLLIILFSFFFNLTAKLKYNMLVINLRFYNYLVKELKFKLGLLITSQTRFYSEDIWFF